MQGTYFLTTKLLIAASLILVGCESAEEKAERVRLEKLYAMSNKGIAEAFATDNYHSAKPWRDVKEQCDLEKIAQKRDKWCEKLDEINAAVPQRNWNFSRPAF